MATFTTIAASEVDADSPITATLMDKLANNSLAQFEGATGAPRLVLKAIEPIVAGSTTRSGADIVITQGGSPFTYTFAFMQTGTIKISITKSLAANSTITVTRYRNRVSAVLGTAVNADLVIASSDILPFDYVTIVMAATSATNYTATVAIQTDGGNLWCGNPSDLTGVTGNDV